MEQLTLQTAWLWRDFRVSPWQTTATKQLLGYPKGLKSKQSPFQTKGDLQHQPRLFTMTLANVGTKLQTERTTQASITGGLARLNARAKYCKPAFFSIWWQYLQSICKNNMQATQIWHLRQDVD